MRLMEVMKDEGGEAHAGDESYNGNVMRMMTMMRVVISRVSSIY